ncbi:pyridine nucleotide-disulfide oxidoreductase [Limnobacter thiooxidans]|uniref:FAD-dependent oxidoreductase n=1 Tax=Limnobacter thiooxidans TaxID=131080 RepID=A0AA86J045_9BURK|nr:pyridine nucleotide-disulfide oxidoreductase [Limnobacter thiooxidans]BET25433.1 FAD-dependent oxidoreductase [Limnobacter thiooxidans]
MTVSTPVKGSLRHVILGNGPAGVVAAEQIRKQRPRDSIVMVGAEPEPPYSRMAIPYLLIGKVGEKGTYLRKDPDHFKKQNIQEVQARATQLDTAGKKVMLDNGDVLEYDKLLIATGARPISPPIPGVNLPGVHPCWTLENARQIIELAKPGSRVLQMGAGFIGCIIMEALALRGVKLTVVEMGNRMVPRMMTEGAGSMIRDWCIKKGVNVYCSTRVEAIEQGGQPVQPSEQGLIGKITSALGFGGGGNNAVLAAKDSAPLRVKLSNGEVLEVDLVISATGVKPNLDFLEGSGLELDQGLLVDDHMQTNIKDVYAAGDVAQVRDFSTGEKTVNMIQPAAADDARIAAQNMMGQGTSTQGSLAMNVLDTLGLIAASFGQWWGAEGGQSVELQNKDEFSYMRLEFLDDVLIGATSLGLTNHVGVMRGLIQGKIHLGEWKDHLLEDPTRLMEAYLACAQSQSTWKLPSNSLQH